MSVRRDPGDSCNPRSCCRPRVEPPDFVLSHPFPCHNSRGDYKEPAFRKRHNTPAPRRHAPYKGSAHDPHRHHGSCVRV
eukprot:6637984-Pyramimonas_sp.AAC.1